MSRESSTFTGVNPMIKPNPKKELAKLKEYINQGGIDPYFLEEIVESKFDQYLIALNESINRGLYDQIMTMITQKFGDIDKIIQETVETAHRNNKEEKHGDIAEVVKQIVKEEFKKNEQARLKMINLASKNRVLNKSLKQGGIGGKHKSLKKRNSIRKTLYGNRL